jgi:acetate kinase
MAARCITARLSITPEVLAELRQLVPLAPLHKRHNLAAIEAVREGMSDVPQVACFDTSFHRGQSAVAERIPLPRELCATGVQRYGFHGLSYEYMASVLPGVAPEISRGRVIVAHLGNGASVSALRDGTSVDTSLGFTAQAGSAWAPGRDRLNRASSFTCSRALGLTAGEVETVLY